MVNRCGIEHPLVTSPVDKVDGFEVVECLECRQSYVIDGDCYVPVQAGSLVDSGGWDEDRPGWDGQREHGAGLDSYWGRLDA